MRSPHGGLSRSSWGAAPGTGVAWPHRRSQESLRVAFAARDAVRRPVLHKSVSNPVRFSLRVKIIALGGAVLVIAVSYVWWLHSVTMPLSLPPPSPEQKTAVGRLHYDIDTTRRNGAIDVINLEHFAWNDVSVEV